MNFHYNNKFSSQWWIFIIVIYSHQNDEFPSQGWISITVMNSYSSEEFSLKNFYFYHQFWQSFSLNLNLNFGWAWPSSASACFCYNCFLFNQCLWQNLYNVKWVKSFKCTSAKKDIKWTTQLVFHSNLIFQPASKSYLGKFTKKQDKAIYQKNSC